MTEPLQKTCKKCGQTKPIIQYPGRRNTCQACLDFARAKTLAKKDSVAWTAELGEKICDMVAAGMTVAEVCELPGMPTPRQLSRWRRTIPEFAAACDLAETQSAAAHLDTAKEVLRQVEGGKLPSSDGRMLFDGHMKLAATLNPTRYGSNATIDVTSAGRPLVDLGAAVQALIDALPTRADALPAPEPLDAEAVPVPNGVLQ